MKLRSLLILGLLAFAGGAAAQQTPHVCGAGPGPDETMAGVQPGGAGVAPTPLCYWKSDAQQRPLQPTGYWEKTWGAIATDGVKGSLGVAIGISSEDEAKQVALSDCKSKGGTNCEIDLAYYNQCGALVVGDGYVSVGAAPNEKGAKQGALSNCKDNDRLCRVYYSACTEPIYHEY